jgi:hypothetical protein
MPTKGLIVFAVILNEIRGLHKHLKKKTASTETMNAVLPMLYYLLILLLPLWCNLSSLWILCNLLSLLPEPKIYYKPDSRAERGKERAGEIV